MALSAVLEPLRMSATVERLPLAELSAAEVSALADLLTRVWPDPLKDHAYRVRRIQQRAGEPLGPAGQVPTAFAIRSGARFLASAAFDGSSRCSRIVLLCRIEGEEPAWRKHWRRSPRNWKSP